MEQTLDAVGLSPARYEVLAALASADTPLALSDLASRLSCVRSNMTQLVDRLEADGLVRRVSDATDRRVVRAELTEAGRAAATAGARQVASVEAGFADALPAADRDTLARLLGVFGAP